VRSRLEKFDFLADNRITLIYDVVERLDAGAEQLHDNLSLCIIKLAVGNKLVDMLLCNRSP
jgi:hypothetical protein